MAEDARSSQKTESVALLQKDQDEFKIEILKSKTEFQEAIRKSQVDFKEALQKSQEALQQVQ